MKRLLPALLSGLFLLTFFTDLAAQTPRTRAYLWTRYETGDKPTQTDYRDVFASFFSKVEDSLYISQIRGVDTLLTDATLTGATDRQIPTAAAVKTYVDNAISGGVGAVTSVFGRTGGITAGAGDYTASQITNTPAGDIAATTVQAALNELDSEKLQDTTGSVDADNIATGAVGADELASSGVTLGTYGSDTQIPVITVDADGRITSASNVAAAGGGGGVADGDKTDIDVSSSGSIWTIDTSAVTTVKIANDAVTGAKIAASTIDSTDIATGGIGNTDLQEAIVTAGKIATGAVGATQLASTAVTPGSYTNTNLTVDADGRITAASNGTGGSGGDAALKDTISHTSHGFSVGNLVNIQSVTGLGQLADADVDSLFAVGIITEVIDANSYVIQTSGIATISGVVAGEQYYTSGTAGAVTTTAPSKVQVAYQGIATNTARLVFDRFSESSTPSTASEISVSDAGGYYAQADVESVLQEVGERVGDIETTQNVGVVSFATKAIMDTTTTTYPANTLALVGNDPVDTLNAYYRFNGSTWGKVNSLYSNTLDETDQVDAVTGFAVEKHLDSVMVREFQELGVPAWTDLVELSGLAQIVGYITSTGATDNNASFTRTDYIPIPDGLESITYLGNWNNASTYLAFYNSSQVFISNVARGSVTITEKNDIPVPANAKYVRASAATGTDIKLLAEQFTSDLKTRMTTAESDIETNTSSILLRLKESEMSYFGDTTGTDLVLSQSVATITGSYIKNTGATESNASFQRTDYVEIPDGLGSITYKGNWNNPAIYLAFYDASKVFISNVARGGVTITEKNDIPVPANAKYVRTSGAIGTDLEVITENFSSLRPDQIDLNTVKADSLSEGIPRTIPYVGTDLMTFYGISQTDDQYINSTGAVQSSSGYTRTDYVPVVGGWNVRYQGFFPNGSTYMAFYDMNKTFISGVAGTASPSTDRIIAVPSTARWIRASATDTATQIKLIVETNQQYTTKSLDHEVDRIDKALGTKQDTLTKFYFEPADYITRTYADPWTKLTNFTQNYLEKDDDCNIVFQGTSVTQGGGYATTKANPSTYPPYCDEYDLPGRAWDYLSLKWPNQYYRRYDNGYITESAGTWNTLTSDTTWDDVAKGMASRMSLSANAQLSFVVPDSAWAFRFIYRSEKHGDNCTIAVAEGNGKLQVQDTVGAWVEANGYVFSTYEPHSSTPVYSPDTLLYGDYSLGLGNTNATKKLFFRTRNGDGSFNQLTGTKNVTITKSSNTAKRLSYWGVEWSQHRFMLSVINAGRGSNAYKDDAPSSTGGSIHYAKTDIMYFKPDLIIVEISHNRYGSTPNETIPLVQKWYFNELPGGGTAGEPLSIDSLIVANGDSTDVLLWTVNVDYENNYEEFTGGAVGYYQGRKFTLIDNRDYTAHWMRTQKSSIAFVDGQGAMREAAKKYYGSYRTGMIPTTAGGYSMMIGTNHPNTRGYSVIWKAMEPMFRF